MVRIRAIQIRLTRQQHEQIKNDSRAKGFASISAYIRFIALHRDEAIANKVCEMHSAIVGKTKDKKHKNGYSTKNGQLQSCF